MFTKPLPSPPLKQIRGGYISLTLKLLHPFPYCLREGDGGRVQKNKRRMNCTFETTSKKTLINRTLEGTKNKFDSV